MSNEELKVSSNEINQVSLNQCFTTDTIIPIHTGAFGINLAKTLYASPIIQNYSNNYKPRPILCDLDRQNLEEI